VITVGFDLQPAPSDPPNISAIAGVQLWVSWVPSPFSTVSMGYSSCLLAMTVSPTGTFSFPGAGDHVPALWRHHLSPSLSAERHIALQAI